jgi:hypothetical protein
MNNNFKKLAFLLLSYVCFNSLQAQNFTPVSEERTESQIKTDLETINQKINSSNNMEEKSKIELNKMRTFLERELKEVQKNTAKKNVLKLQNNEVLSEKETETREEEQASKTLNQKNIIKYRKIDR